MRRATIGKYAQYAVTGNFYPRSPCGERRPCLIGHGVGIAISIHALLAESDNLRSCMPTGPRYFYPRSPCGERQKPPLIVSANPPYFYPRSPCGERLGDRRSQRRHRDPISIHALLAESDRAPFLCRKEYQIFLSTLSLRRATVVGGARADVGLISIHALLAESDVDDRVDPLTGEISIHALLAESDRSSPTTSPARCNFYPRSPCGERRSSLSASSTQPNFYPRSPCGERPLIHEIK